MTIRRLPMMAAITGLLAGNEMTLQRAPRAAVAPGERPNTKRVSNSPAVYGQSDRRRTVARKNKLRRKAMGGRR